MNPLENATAINPHVGKWVTRMAELCAPAQVHWCDGSEAEKEYLTQLIARAGSNMSKAARLASIDRTTLYRLMDKHNFQRDDLTGMPE